MEKKTFHNITYECLGRVYELQNTIDKLNKNVYLFVKLLHEFFPEEKFYLHFMNYFTIDDFDISFYNKDNFDVGEDLICDFFSLHNFSTASEKQIEMFMIDCLVDLEKHYV